MKFDYLVFIGRFSPVHSGHIHVIRKALEQSENLILVIGSDKKGLDTRNPLTTKQRIELIQLSLTPEEMNRIHFAPQVDYTYNDDRWIASIQASVSSITMKPFRAGPTKIGIIGYNKDHTSYYLKKFPQWEYIPVSPINNQNSTDFRRYLFEGKDYSSYIETKDAKDYLWNWTLTDEFKRLQQEYEFVKDYKQQWEKSPYPPTFLTVDALVRQSGHILLVKRLAQPGKGLWALPGGFVNQTEKLEDAVLRELYEETRIDVPKPVLKGSIVNRMTFDEPTRSARGRTVSECFDFKLNDSFDLPKVKGSDDAEKAFWVSFSDVVKNQDKFFEDHFSVIQVMTGI